MVFHRLKASLAFEGFPECYMRIWGSLKVFLSYLPSSAPSSPGAQPTFCFSLLVYPSFILLKYSFPDFGFESIYKIAYLNFEMRLPVKLCTRLSIFLLSYSRIKCLHEPWKQRPPNTHQMAGLGLRHMGDVGWSEALLFSG